MLLTALLSYIAGLLTALAPCVLPLLPIILGGSFDGKKTDKKRPYIIVASLVVSLILFTILLKASTVLIGVDPKVWTYVSGGLVIILGIFMLMPTLWAKIIAGVGIESKSQSLLGKAFTNKNKNLSAVLIGAALGPVFSSCSPTYAWVIATVLPSNATLGVFYLAIYCLGVATSLLAIALLGRKLLERVKWASNPKGWFQRGIAVLFIIVGLFVVTGLDKKVQTYLVNKDWFNLIQVEKKLVPKNQNSSAQNSNQTDNNTKQGIDPYQAPELKEIAGWINSDPQTIAGLKGKVVLIDFWTYSCINCQRTQPYLNDWYQKYRDSGFEIIGVHAPEFAFEKVPENVKKAGIEANIKYPIALDNKFSTWQAYNNQFWPAKYLIDKDGQVRYTHFGEGDYEITERFIQKLLKESGKNITAGINQTKPSQPTVNGQSPETYLGYERGERFANAKEFKPDQDTNYNLLKDISEHQWSLGGNWRINATETISKSDNAVLAFKFSAREVYLVMDGPSDKPVSLKLNGESVNSSNNGGSDVGSSGQIHLEGARLYKLINLPSFSKNNLVEITVPAGTTVNAFTFGS